MMFDPYRKWLGILPKDQPPNHYRLLSLELFEHDLDVIEGAADRAMAFIRQYQSGEQAQFAAKLLNEIATARLCLLKPDSKQKYDAKLRQETSGQHETGPTPAVPLATPVAKTVDRADDGIAFSFDTEPRMVSPVAKPAARLASGKAIKRAAKAKSSNAMFIMGGVGAAVCVALLVVMNLGEKPRQKTGSVSPDIVGSKSAPTSAQDHSKSTTETTAQEKLSEKKRATANKSRLDIESIGPAVDLLEALELPRDQLLGDWKKAFNSLSAGPNGRIYFPVELPDAYQIKLVVRRISGSDGCGIGFVSEGRAGIAIIDGWDSTFSGLCVDGHEPTGNCTSLPGAHFQTAQKATIVLTVYPNHVLATFDGKNMIDWRGQSGRHFVPTFLNVPNRETPFFVTLGSPMEVESAELTPIRVEPRPKRVARLENGVDAIPLLDADLDPHQGVWSLGNSTLESPGSAFAKYSLPVAVPDEYTLSANVELPVESAKSTLVIGLPAGKSWCSIALVNGDSLGLENIDGIRWDGHATWMRGAFTTPGKPFNLACTVTKSTIRMDLDDRTILNWSGDFQRLSVQNDWAPIDAMKLMFGTRAKCKFRDIKLGPPTSPPGLPSHPKIEIGQPLDLISLIDPKRDALLGTWTKDGRVLNVSSDVDTSKLVVPCEIPAEYKLTIRVTREVGGKSDGDLVLKLPTENSLAEVVLDGWGSNTNGMFLDYLLPNDPNNVTAQRVPAVPPGSAQDLIVYVRKTGLKVMNGDKVITEFSGNPDRLSPTKSSGSPGGRIAIGCIGSRFRFEKMEIEPLEPTSFPAVKEIGSDGNLMSVLDPQRDARRGEWKLDASGLQSPKNQAAWIRLPVPVPEKYILTATVERKSGTSDFLLGLVVGQSVCTAAIDGTASRNSGLTELDGKHFDVAPNLTRREHSRPIFPVGEAVKIRAIVIPGTIMIDCGNKEIIRWHGDSRRLSSNLTYRPPNYSNGDRQHLGIGSWESEFLIRDLVLKPIDDDAGERIAARFDGVFPTVSQSKVPFSDSFALVADTSFGGQSAMKEGDDLMVGKTGLNAPEQLSKGKVHDLLQLVKLPEDSLAGKWTQQNSSLVCEPSTDTDARFMVPVALRGAYELDIEFTRRSGDGLVGVILPVGVSSCSLFLGLNAGAVSGFGMIDGLHPNDFPARSTAAVRPGKLVNGKRYQLHIEVIQSAERVTLLATLDGKKFVGFKGAIAELSPHWATMLPCLSSIGVMVQQSQAEIHKLELRLKSEARGYPMGSDWKSPLSQVAPGPPKELLARCLTWNGHKYLISNETMTFGMAQRFAAQLRGRLLTISSPEEETFIYEQGHDRQLWMSLWRRERSREWQDERNRPMRYVPKWGPREPNLTPPELLMAYNTIVTGNVRGMCDHALWSSLHACIEWGEEYPEDE